MKNRTFLFILYFVLFFSAIHRPAAADWINLTGAENATNIAEIHIADDHMRIELEIFVKDIMILIGLFPTRSSKAQT